MSDLSTGSRSIRVGKIERPGRVRLRDLGFLVGLSVLALLGLAPTFTGAWFAVVGILGLLVGVGLTELRRVRRWPAVAPILLAVVVFVLLGGPLCLRSTGPSAYLPLPGTVTDLVDQLLFGWKELLTTLPPLDGSGPALVIPWVLGLATGTAGGLLVDAHRWSRLPRLAGVALPLAAPLALLVGVVLLGVHHAASVLLQGVLFAAGALGWLALRSMALATRTSSGTGTVRRGLVGAGLVALAATLAWPVGTWLAGGDDERVVLRSYVEPPFDVGEYPSPLASFRNYVEVPPARESSTNVYRDPLLQVDGVEPGTKIRFATLDSYDGMVWRAAEDTDPTTSLDTYQRVSRTIDNPLEGRSVDVTVTVEEGYDSEWLPTVGGLTSLEFTGGHAEQSEESFRYNLAASSAIVPTRVSAGDRYHFTAVLPDTSLDEHTELSDQLPPAYDAAAFLEPQANDWTQGQTDPTARVFAVAKHLRTEGRYTDGVSGLERIYRSGHNQKRLGEEFVDFPIMAGNDEQYAATMALIASRIGVPARVVMGAEVPEGGLVKGENVKAWVELQAADGSWRELDTETFMGNEKPADLPPQEQEEMSGSQVPPPAPIPPPSTESEQTDTQLKNRSDTDDDASIWALPLWVKIVLAVVGGPLLLLAAVVGAIAGLKAWRRRRRRTRGRPSARIGGGWREYVDQARDLGHPVPVRAGLTRREQAGRLGVTAAHDLARAADGHVFGPAGPGEESAAAYWQQVESQRRALRAGVGRWRRFRALVSLRTFLSRWTREPDPASPSSPEARNKGGHQLVGPS